MKIASFFEKYSFFLILVFCFGVLSPNMQPKIPIMDTDAIDFLEKISGSNIKKQIFWISVFLLLIWRSVNNTIFTINNARYLTSVIFLCCLCMFSSLWSVEPAISIKRSVFQFIFCFSVIVSFCYARHHNTIEESIYYTSVLILGMILFSVLLGVGFTNNYQLAGFANSKNVLGQILLVILVLFISYLRIELIPVDKYKYTFVLLVSSLLLTTSKTSILLFVAFIAFLKFNRIYLKVIAFFTLFSLFTLLIFLPSLSFYLFDIIHIGQYVEGSFFTGRGVIWDTLYFDMVYFDKFLSGYGFGAYFGAGNIPWFFDEKYSFLRHIASSHNGYIDILLQFGMPVSLGIFFLLIRMGARVNNSCILAGLIVVIIYNFTESAFLKDQVVMWLLLLVLLSLNSVISVKNANYH